MKNCTEEKIQFGSIKLEANEVIVGTDHYGKLRVIGKAVATGVKSQATLEKQRAEQEAKEKELKLIEESKMYVQIIENRMYLTIACGDEFTDFEIAFKERDERQNRGPIAKAKSFLTDVLMRIFRGGRK